MRTLIVLLLSMPMALGAPVPKEVKKQSELDRFVGVWWESCFNGTASADASTSRRFVFNRDGTAGILQREGAKPYEYNFVIDETTNPPSFTWNNLKGSEQYHAIYRLENDTLFIVFMEATKPMATKIENGAGTACYELKRIK